MKYLIAITALLLAGCYSTGAGYDPYYAQQMQFQQYQQAAAHERMMNALLPQRTSCINYPGGFNCF